RHHWNDERFGERRTQGIRLRQIVGTYPRTEAVVLRNRYTVVPRAHRFFQHGFREMGRHDGNHRSKLRCLRWIRCAAWIGYDVVFSVSAELHASEPFKTSNFYRLATADR